MTCIYSIFSAHKLKNHRQSSLLYSLLSIPRTVKPNGSAIHSTSSHRCIIRDLDTLHLVMQSVLWKEILAMSRDRILVISIGVNDRGTQARVHTTEHICPIAQTQLMICQTEQASSEVFCSQFFTPVQT